MAREQMGVWLAPLPARRSVARRNCRREPLLVVSIDAFETAPDYRNIVSQTMRTVLLVEDSFVESYELEYRLKELGYTVKIAATLEGAKDGLRQLEGGLAGIVCDNKLISGKPIAATFYAYARSRASSIPFIVYSAFPPRELPKDDPFLAVVRKPFMDDVLKHLRLLGPIADKRQTVLSIPSGREAA